MASHTEDGDSPPCATPSVMDDIPLKIAAMIVGNLLEYDLAPTQNSEYTEYPCDAMRRSDLALQKACWETITATARSIVLAARLTCQKLYNASPKSFANLLADRKFRYTKCGVKDLAQVEQKIKASSVHRDTHHRMCRIP
jgi:hypothetical protein